VASGLKITVNDLISKGLNQRLAKQKNLRPVFKKVGRFEQRQVRRRIRITKEDPNGKKWQRWSNATEAARLRKGNVPQGLLYDTKTLHDSITVLYSKHETRIRALTDYARFLQFGTTKMPARPFMGWSDVSLKFIKRVFRRHFK